MNKDIRSPDIRRFIDGVRALQPREALGCYVMTLGCQQNEADSEKIRGMARDMGYRLTSDAEDASLIIVNTCAVRQHAELKALSLIGTYKHIKTQNPDVLIGVVGCMAAEPHVVETIKKNFPYVSFTLEPNLLYRFPETVYRSLSQKRRTFLFGEDAGEVTEGLTAVRSVAHRAWVSVMYGCNNFCSYCIVPYVRGRERSRDASAVLDECRALIADGCAEITLLGQNVNSYRSGDVDFPALLEEVASLPGDFLVRFMTSHPKDVSDGLIAVMARHPEKIAPAFHLPLQSGSDRILKEMNRTYDSAHYFGIVEKLRRAIPDIAITTDVIVAFPGETEEDFMATLDMVTRVGYDGIFSFIYSPREGTRAAKMESRVTEEEKNDRMARLIALGRKIAYEKNLAYENTDVRVLVDFPAREGGDNYVGRTPSGKLVRLTATDAPVGRFVRVHIDKATPFDLFGHTV